MRASCLCQWAPFVVPDWIKGELTIIDSLKREWSGGSSEFCILAKGDDES